MRHGLGHTSPIWKRRGALASLLAVASFGLGACAEFAAQQILEHTDAGDVISLYPAMRVGQLVSDYRAAFGECPLSRDQLESAILEPEASGEQAADLFDGFRQLRFYEGHGSQCIIEFSQPRQRAAQAFGQPAYESGPDLWLPPRRGVLRLQPSTDEGAVRKTPITLDLFEVAEDGSGRVTESALPPSAGNLEYNRESNEIRFNLKPVSPPRGGGT